MKRFIIILGIAMSLYKTAPAQLVFYFIPDVYGRSIDGLGTFQVQNLSNTLQKGQVSILVQENTSNKTVVNITTPATTFNPGNNSFPKGLFANSVFHFSNNSLASIVNQTRNFPPGEYSFCFRFTPSDKQGDEYENCFDAAIQPLLPISLLLPADQDTICLKRPVLSWQPPMPFHVSMRFRLLLTEKKNNNDKVESILKNAPLLLLDNISTTTINYPANYPELKEGKTYCWQVAAYQQGLIISTSEVWEFTVQCKEKMPPVPSDSYRELKLLMNGNYYIANRYLKFSFRNDYHIRKLKYEIIDLAEEGKKIKRLPEIEIQNGLNMIDLDLSDSDLKPGDHYILKVYPFNEPPVEVRFIYQEKDVE